MGSNYMAEKYLNAAKGLGLALIFASISAISLDLKIALAVRSFSMNPANLPYVEFFRLITDVGLAGPYIGLALILWISGSFAKKKLSERRRLWALFGKRLFYSSIVTGLIVHLIKYTVGRERPYHSILETSWNQQMGSLIADFQSFPSGHSQVCFTVAAVMAAHSPRYKRLFLLIAALIASTRMMTQSHFLSDVIFGSALGWWISGLVLARINYQPSDHSA